MQGIGARDARQAHRATIVVARRTGVPIRVRDVAKVVEGREIRRAAVTADGSGEVVLGLGFMMMGENSHDVTTRCKPRLDEVEKTLPPGVNVDDRLRPHRRWSTRCCRTVRTNLLEGALLVVAVLFAFLGQPPRGLDRRARRFRSRCCSPSTCMLRAGIAGSLMSLGAIDFGLVVDSSVIMVENSVRQARTIGARTTHAIEVVRDAALEVRKPTMFGELIIMIVYLPDPLPGGDRREAVPADGAHRDLRAGRLDAAVADADAGAREPVLAAAHARSARDVLVRAAQARLLAPCCEPRCVMALGRARRCRARARQCGRPGDAARLRVRAAAA